MQLALTTPKWSHAAGGRHTDGLDLPSEQGWTALQRYGVATVVDLRSPVQTRAPLRSRRSRITTTLVPLEEGLDNDLEFTKWMSQGWLATPLYYTKFIERWPDRCVSAVAAVVEASPGGVVVHCGKGSDRTGLVVVLLLALVGVLPDEIVSDYEMTGPRLRSARAKNLSRDDDTQLNEAVLERERTSARSVLLAMLKTSDVPATLQRAGLTDRQLRALRLRLVHS